MQPESYTLLRSSAW